MRFESQYHQHWEPPNEAALVAFLLYELRCETFERGICRRRDSYGNAIPTDPWENKRCIRHSHHQMKVLKAKLGPRPRQRYKAEWRAVSELSHERQRRWLEQIYYDRRRRRESAEVAV